MWCSGLSIRLQGLGFLQRPGFDLWPSPMTWDHYTKKVICISVFIVYSCITNFPKLRGFIISPFLGVRNWGLARLGSSDSVSLRR